MVTNYQVNSNRPSFSGQGVLSTSAAQAVAAAVESVFQNIQTLACDMAREEYQKMAAAHNQQSVLQEDALLTIAEAAALLSVVRQTIHNWVRSGQLKSYKLGGRTYFKKAEVTACLVEKMRPNGTRKHERRQFAVSKQNGKGRGDA